MSFACPRNPLRPGMSQPQTRLWQVTLRGPFTRLKNWAGVQEAKEDVSWLSLSIFETKLPEGRLTLIFADRESAGNFVAQQAVVPAAQAQCAALANDNWVQKSLDGLPPVRAGRFFVHGKHHHPPDDSALVAICIEAGEAFGSGHHGTTKGCLLAFEDMLKAGAPKTVLDLGSGAGTLAIAAAKTLPEAQITATDIDPVAVRVGENNAASNGIAGRVRFLLADGFGHAQLQNQRFSLIFANILAVPLKALAPQIAAALQPGGRVLLSGILNEQAGGVRNAFELAGLALVEEIALDEWRVLAMRKADT